MRVDCGERLAKLPLVLTNVLKVEHQQNVNACAASTQIIGAEAKLIAGVSRTTNTIYKHMSNTGCSKYLYNYAICSSSEKNQLSKQPTAAQYDANACVFIQLLSRSPQHKGRHKKTLYCTCHKKLNKTVSRRRFEADRSTTP